MKHSSAVKRLEAITTDLDRLAGFDEDFLLEEAWVFGELLDAPDTLDVVSLTLVVDLPAQDVTWCARPGPAEALASLLRLEKYPLRWFWRPTVWPVWNHTIERAVRFWSKGAGADTAALEALARRRFEDLTVVGPPDAQALRGQLLIDYQAARLHLREVVDCYADPRLASRAQGLRRLPRRPPVVGQGIPRTRYRAQGGGLRRTDRRFRAGRNGGRHEFSCVVRCACAIQRSETPVAIAR